MLSFSATVTSTNTMRFIKTKYYVVIRRNCKIKSLILCSDCVTCYDIIRQGATEGKRDIKLVIRAVHNTYLIAYWYIEVNTDLHKCDVIVLGIAVIIFMYDYSCSTVDSSTTIWISGTRPHRERTDRTPVDSKMTK